MPFVKQSLALGVAITLATACAATQSFEQAASENRGPAYADLPDNEPALRDLIAQDPSNADAWYALASLLEREERQDEVLPLLEKAFERNPLNLSLADYLLRKLNVEKRFPDVDKVYRRLLESEARSAQLAWKYADWLETQKRQSEADHWHLQATEFSEDGAYAAIRLLHKWQTAGRTTESDQLLKRISERYPDLAREINWALAQMISAETEDIIRYCQAQLQATPGHLDAAIKLAETLEMKGRQAEAEAVLRDLLRLNPQPEAHAALALLLTRLGRWPEAKAVWQSAIAEYPNSAELRRLYAEDLARQPLSPENLTLLEILFLRVSALSPRDGHDFWEGVYWAVGEKRPEEAKSILQRALAVNPTSVIAYRNLANFYLQDQNWAALEVLLKQEQRHVPEEAASFWDGLYTKARAGRWKEAPQTWMIPFCRWALKHVPDNADIWSLYAGSLADSEQAEEAVDAYRQFLQLRPDHSEGRKELGKQLAILERHAEAETEFNQVLARSPDDEEAQEGLYLALVKSGRASETIELLQQWIRANPNSFDHHIRLGEQLRESKRFDEAERTYRTSVSANSRDPRAYNNLAILLLEKKQWKEARALLEAAMEFADEFDDPDLIRVVLNQHLAMAEERQGHWREAEKFYREAMKLNRDDGYFSACVGRMLLKLGQIKEGNRLITEGRKREPKADIPPSWIWFAAD